MNIIMMAHGTLANSLLKSTKMILGPIDNRVQAIDFGANESLEQLSNKLEKQLNKEMNLIFCDLKGGTPFNTAYLLRQKYPIKIVCGMNLGMLLEYFMHALSNDELPSLAIAKDAGIKAIEVFDLD
ncbi:PTS mannose transporter subunit IID [Enterococcus florum]|uniref:PTS mannose transporter subunit IID n=1 Tax=Enterococcus florum TaxID=2480627 RepID=A0A4P5PC51_9ENTE|nr:hypothetical protein [Enterococcus florum]GCF95650.1 PTS mannose transporter subunit IID [Enterococcus florum]